MRYPKWFARWRLQVWDDRLRDYRRAWQEAIADEVLPDSLERVSVDVFYEQVTNRALLKRTLWRKRAGIRKLSAAPDRPES